MKLFTLCLLAAAALPAVAQSEDPLDELVVTASRTPLSIREVGAAVSVITRSDIERREARNVSELLRSVPGFAISHTGVVGSQTQVRLRGSEANHVLVLIDGVRANDPATGDEFRWEYLSTANIERIEIVRGPQSALWGSDAVAGVVHIITRSGSHRSGFNGYAEGGSFGTTNASIGGSFGTERASFSANLESLRTDGSNISRVGDENDDSDLTTANLSARFAATDAITLNASVRAVDAYTQFDPTDFFVTGLPTDGDVSTDTENFYAQAGLDIAPAGPVSHGISLRWFDSDNRNKTNGLDSGSTASDRLTAAYQADISLGDNRVSLALEHERTSFTQRGDAAPWGDPNQKQEMDTSSAVAEYQGLSHDRFKWIISARYDDNSDFKNALNGKLSASYTLGDSTTLRASIGTGRKNPTFTERFGYFADQFVGNPNLKPERSVSYDMGLEQGFGNVSVQASLFHQDLEDEIIGYYFDPVTFEVTAINNPEKSERSGAELSGRWQVNEQFALGAHYTYTDSTEPLAGAQAREVRRPKHMGGLSADFAGQRFGASLNADYGGERTDLFFPPWPNPMETVTLDKYWLVDLALRFQATGNVSVFAKGTNLLDEKYEQVYGFRTLGRAGYLGVRVNFGE